MSDALRDAGRLLASGVAPDGLLTMLSTEQRAALARAALGPDLEQALQSLRHLATGLRGGFYERRPSVFDSRKHDWVYEVRTRYGPESPQIKALKALILTLTNGQSAAPHEGGKATPVPVLCMDCGADSGQETYVPLGWRCSACVSVRSGTRARQVADLRMARHQAGLCRDCGGERDVEGSCLTGVCQNLP